MKICYLADASSIHTQRWVSYFAEKGDEVHLISYNHAHIAGVKVYVLPNLKNRFLTFILRFFEVKRLIKKIKPDILHAHYIDGYGWHGALTRFHPFVMTPWGTDVLVAPKKSRMVKLAAKFVLTKADSITCDAEHIKEPILKLGAKVQDVNLICFGIDTQKFKPMQRSKEIREKLGILNSPTVISLRSLEPIYDIESLISALPSILNRISDVKLVIVGKGSMEAKLKQLARSLSVSDSIRFIGSIPNNELPNYFASVDVYVSTSLSDAGLAASTAEAMACGLPVVITDFGDNREWVEDGVNGFIVPLKDPKSLAEKIIYLLKNKNVRMEFGRRNRKVIEDRSNHYKEMEQMRNIYIDLVKRYIL